MHSQVRDVSCVGGLLRETCLAWDVSYVRRVLRGTFHGRFLWDVSGVKRFLRGTSLTWDVSCMARFLRGMFIDWILEMFIHNKMDAECNETYPAISLYRFHEVYEMIKN